jgi:phosphoglycolate phosphatase-like HAD superfamily hydrolase
MTVDHIVWDWNGTIFGDSIALIEATIDAFRECGMSTVTRADYQRHHTQPIPTFYERLAGRALTDEEQRHLDRSFRSAYARHRATATLTADAVTALTRWSATGRRQSLLSMYPHDELVLLVRIAGIEEFFARIDGSTGRDVARKAPHLARHLERQDLSPERTLVVGDSVDDALAARECGASCLIYHPGADALHTRDHFADLGVPIVTTLEAAVDHARSRERSQS